MLCRRMLSPLDDELTSADAEATAALFKALADPTRVRIVNMLARSEEPACVCELIHRSGSPSRP